jgi:hypothetical protein
VNEEDRLRIRRSLLAVPLFLSVTSGALAELPTPIDVVAPGGRGLPPVPGKAPSETPAISMISDVTFPDETLKKPADANRHVRTE